MNLSIRSTAEHIPIVTTLLLEWANVAQIVRMMRERNAAGQSLLGWASVWLALVLWAIYYRVVTPQHPRAFWATIVGIGMNSVVIGTVVYFRYLRGL